MRKELEKILRLPDIESRVCGILISNKLVTLPKDNPIKYSNLVVTSKAVSAVQDLVQIDTDFIKAYRDKFPPGKKATSKEVHDKMIELVSELDDNYQEVILAATDFYISELSDETYCEKAGNFISKQLKGGVTRSTLREYIERLEEYSPDISFGNDLI